MTDASGSKNQELDSSLVARLSKLSLVQTVALVLVLTVTVGTAGFALNLVARYTDDRIPGLMELELERSGRMAFDLKERMDARTLKAFEANTDRFPISLDRLKLPRFPRYGEVFLSQYEGKFIRIGGTPEGKIWIDMTPFAPDLPAVTQGSFYLITTFGDFVTSSDKDLRLSSGQVTNRDIVRTFFQSGVEQSVRIESSESGDMLVGFRSVPSTNLVIFFEKPLTGLLAPLHKALLMLAIGGVAVALAAGILGYLVLQIQLRPLGQLKVYAVNLILGRGLRAGKLPSVPQRSEFKPIAEAYALLIGRLHTSEGRIFGIVQYIKMVHVFQQKTQAAGDLPTITGAFAELAFNLLQPLPQNPSFFVYIHPQIHPSEGMVLQKIGAHQGRIMIAGLSPVQDPMGAKLIQDLGKSTLPVIDRSGVHIPLRVGSGLLGLLTIRNYPNGTHFEVVSPLLTIALGILSQNLSNHLEWVEQFLDEIGRTVDSIRPADQSYDEGSADMGSPNGAGMSQQGGIDFPEPSDAEFASGEWTKGA